SPHTPWVPLPKYRGLSKAGDYGDYAAEVDDAMGQVMRAVDAASNRNTILIFTSDNGADWKLEDLDRYAHRANANWKGEKADIWDGGHRIPFLIRWPNRVPAGRVSDELGCLSDLMATLAAILGIRLPSNAAEDSYNLLPAWLGKNTKPVRPDIIHHSVDGMFAIRRGDWKLAQGLGSGGFSPPARVDPGPGGPKGQLYDLGHDPEEKNNLYQKRPDMVDSLATLLDKYKQQGYTRPQSQ
ncbi:MAG: sulfatase-like hydrolase/transferase, partial [Acidobacteriaceae bacterium]|nr:sulfatase-like hydrolase/transferase [Acidobacteriaceae bacterium]